MKYTPRGRVPFGDLFGTGRGQCQSRAEPGRAEPSRPETSRAEPSQTGPGQAEQNRDGGVGVGLGRVGVGNLFFLSLFPFGHRVPYP